MTLFSRSKGFIQRLVRGEDVVMVNRDQKTWDHQFKKGAWDRLILQQPNTMLLAELILDHAMTSKKSLRVLDVGCGNGGLARLLTVSPMISYVGTDISEMALTTARGEAPQGHFEEGDAKYPSSSLGTFDIIVFNEVFYYLDPTTVLPRYASHTLPTTLIMTSVIRSWRSPFVWGRIKKWIHKKKEFVVRDEHPHTWDLAIGTFVTSRP